MKNIDIEVINRAKKGDEEALSSIILNYRGIIKLKTRQFFIIGSDRDDIAQECLIGLLKAIKYYREDRDSSFYTFAGLCMQRQVITAIRCANNQSNLMNSNATSEEDLRCNRGTPEDLAIVKDEFEQLSIFLKSKLSSFEWKVFNNLMSGLDYKEIAVKLNKTAKSIDNTLQRMKKKAIEWLNNS